MGREGVGQRWQEAGLDGHHRSGRSRSRSLKKRIIRKKKKQMQKIRNVLQVKTNTARGCLIGPVVILISLQYLHANYMLKLRKFFKLILTKKL